MKAKEFLQQARFLDQRINSKVREDLDRLISIKREINDTLEQIDEVDYRIVLQKRYLEMCSWEEIACDIDKKVRWVQMLHGRGLDKVQEFLDRSA